ncbi:PREDICTED: growth-regulating factor 1-like isoform X2 [Ipomoea nil]|uniref:growth-regulating factor 1-like isoform X2 n=1 Tax=Ipomoea nil TaxID=35883 RepID=UPI000900B16C|nr:PREDICTED: growth-regulating factor 1-like isoform X2 [Ipomoea nil]
MMNNGRSRLPFTATQWQELEHQALIYKYMVSGMPVPPDLLYSIRRSLDSSLSSKLLLHQPPQHMGWSCFQMGFGKKIDPEPGRCRRTDGKKWRCSKEAYPDSKYCERHMHRGRNRSRKPVEVINTVVTPTSSSAAAAPSTPPPPTAIPFSSINKNTPTPPSLLYPHSTPSRSHQGIALSSQDHTTNFLLDSLAYSRNNGYGHGMKDEVDEHVFFSSEGSGSIRSSISGSNNLADDSAWQLAPLTMASPPLGQLKQRDYCGPQNGYSASYLHLHEASRQQRQGGGGGEEDEEGEEYYGLGGSGGSKTVGVGMMNPEDQQPKKVMHHFFDEWPKENKDSWLDSGDGDKYSAPRGPHLSISVPNSSHDFFITHNEK